MSENPTTRSGFNSRIRLFPTVNEELGVDPEAALQELQVEDGQGNIHRELAAYILLMSRIWLLKPLAWRIGLPVIRPALTKVHH